MALWLTCNQQSSHYISTRGKLSVGAVEFSFMHTWQQKSHPTKKPAEPSYCIYMRFVGHIYTLHTSYIRTSNAIYTCFMRHIYELRVQTQTMRAPLQTALLHFCKGAPQVCQHAELHFPNTFFRPCISLTLNAMRQPLSRALTTPSRAAYTPHSNVPWKGLSPAPSPA